MNRGIKLFFQLVCVAAFAILTTQNAQANILQDAMDAGLELFAAEDATELERQRHLGILGSLPPTTNAVAITR